MARFQPRVLPLQQATGPAIAQGRYELDSHYRALQEDTDVPLNNQPDLTIAQTQQSVLPRSLYQARSEQALSSIEDKACSVYECWGFSGLPSFLLFPSLLLFSSFLFWFCCSVCAFLGVGERVNGCESRRYIASVGDETPKNIRAIATEHLDSNPLNLLLDVAFFFAERLADLSIERFAFEEELRDFSLGW